MTPVLAAAVWPELERTERRALVVPLGSLEQHGPHLPLDTDTRIATEVARRAAGTRDGVWLAPALPLGSSGEHAAFPGTLSIGGEALTIVLVELVRHACGDWPGVLLVNAHGGNVEAVTAAVEQVAGEGRLCAAWHTRAPGADAHAGRAETAIMLALHPDTVRLGAARPGALEPLETLLPALRSRGVRAVSPSGVLGDPRGATAAEGRELLAGLAAGCTAALDALLARAA